MTSGVGDGSRNHSAGLYREAGVNIDAGNETVLRIARHAKRTRIPGVLSGIGGFGGCFSLEPYGLDDAVLVAGADGVGTKLKIAFAMDIHDTVGIDCVAMNVDDVVAQGARPLFFLDYLAVGRLDPRVVEEIVKGIAEGCIRAGCALLGGETAEMPGMYADGEYDLAGFAVGVSEKGRLIGGGRIRPGCAVVGLMSSGLHSNGYSLARRVLLEEARLGFDLRIPELGRTLGEELLEPTRIYSRALVDLFASSVVDVLGIAHITGGGFYDNIPRILPPGTRARIDGGSWAPLPIFHLIERLGRIERTEMFRVFNMGIGMVLVVPQDECDTCVRFLEGRGFPARIIGEIAPGEPGAPGVDIV